MRLAVPGEAIENQVMEKMSYALFDLNSGKLLWFFDHAPVNYLMEKPFFNAKEFWMKLI